MENLKFNEEEVSQIKNNENMLDESIFTETYYEVDKILDKKLYVNPDDS